MHTEIYVTTKQAQQHHMSDLDNHNLQM